MSYFFFVTAQQQQQQPQQQNNHNCSWVETKQSLGNHHHTNLKLNDRAVIGHNSENKGD